MIYVSPNHDDPIRQGDIFFGVPRITISLSRIPVVSAGNEPEVTSWDVLRRSGETVTALLAVKPVTAIVASQDCDAVRAPDITLCEVRPFRDVERSCADITSPKKWSKIITQQARLNYKWFYLPPDQTIGFADRMGVDFQVVFTVPRLELEELRELRKGRLNDLAEAHFRERIAEFFRRYPYDEWYPLSREEYDTYAKDRDGVTPFQWQVTPSSQP